MTLRTMKRILLFSGIIGTLFLILPFARCAVTIDFTGGALFTNLGAPLPTGSLVLLVADTANNGYGTVVPGSLNNGAFLNGADDMILARATVTDLGGFQGVLDNFAGSLLGNWGTGDPLLLYWFSSVTGASTSLSGGERYGFYTSATGQDGSDPWVTPADGTPAINLSFATITAGGTSNADTAGYATSLVAIPEPSTFAAIAGVVMLGFAAFRRRKIVQM